MNDRDSSVAYLHASGPPHLFPCQRNGHCPDIPTRCIRKIGSQRDDRLSGKALPVGRNSLPGTDAGKKMWAENSGLASLPHPNDAICAPDRHERTGRTASSSNASLRAQAVVCRIDRLEPLGRLRNKLLRHPLRHKSVRMVLAHKFTIALLDLVIRNAGTQTQDR